MKKTGIYAIIGVGIAAVGAAEIVPGNHRIDHAVYLLKKDTEDSVKRNAAEVDLDMESVDVDGDGKPDVLMVDTDGDGAVDTVLADTTGDGVVDTIMVDTTGDGQLDTMLVDEQGTGEFVVADEETEIE